MASRLAATCSASSRLRTSCNAALAGDFGDRPLAAAAGVDLRLDDGQRPADAREGIGDGPRRIGDKSAGNGDAGVAENLFRLVFVDLHGDSMRSCTGATPGAPRPDEAGPAPYRVS